MDRSGALCLGTLLLILLSIAGPLSANLGPMELIIVWIIFGPAIICFPLTFVNDIKQRQFNIRWASR